MKGAIVVGFVEDNADQAILIHSFCFSHGVLGCTDESFIKLLNGGSNWWLKNQA